MLFKAVLDVTEPQPVCGGEISCWAFRANNKPITLSLPCSPSAKLLNRREIKMNCRSYAENSKILLT